MMRSKPGARTAWLAAALACGLVLAAGTWVASAQTQDAPAARPTQILDDTWLEGTVGSLRIRAFVGEQGWPRDSAFWGMYYDVNTWMPIALDGDWIGPARIRLSEGDPRDERPKPHFLLNVSGRAVEGTWTSADGHETRRVRLNRIARPPQFADAIRRGRRRFDDSRWPIAFDYPAGWRLDVSDSELTLRSPDPGEWLFDNELSCTRGQGLPTAPAPGDPPTEFQFAFFRGRDGWLAEQASGRWCEVDDSCVAPSARTFPNGTLMSAAIGYRMYGPHGHGYRGMADADAHLIVAGRNEWVVCRDRLFDSPARLEVPRRPAR